MPSDALGSEIAQSDTGRNVRPVIDTRSVTDDVFEERAVDGGLWRPRVPHRRERGEDDGEDAAIGFAVPLQEEGLGGSDELILLLGGERRPLLKTERWQGPDDLPGAFPCIRRLLRRRGRAPGQQQPDDDDRGASYGRFTRTRCP